MTNILSQGTRFRRTEEGIGLHHKSSAHSPKQNIKVVLTRPARSMGHRAVHTMSSVTLIQMGSKVKEQLILKAHQTWVRIGQALLRSARTMRMKTSPTWQSTTAAILLEVDYTLRGPIWRLAFQTLGMQSTLPTQTTLGRLGQSTPFFRALHILAETLSKVPSPQSGPTELYTWHTILGPQALQAVREVSKLQCRLTVEIYLPRPP